MPVRALGHRRDATTTVALAVTLLLGLVVMTPRSADAQPVDAAAEAAAVRKCFGKRPTIVVRGRSGRGTKRADVILVTRRGGARVDAGRGADRICGGRGRDTLIGGAGNDRISSGGGRDRLRGGSGIDSFRTRGRGVRTDAAIGERINGRRKLTRAGQRAGTVQLAPADVLAVADSAAGTQTLTLRTLPSSLRVGSPVVLPSGRERPGLVGVVTELGPSSVVLRPASLDEAYSNLRIAMETTLGATDAYVARASAAKTDGLKFKVLASDFGCKGLEPARP